MKLVFGVGVNDADYHVCTKVNGRRVVCKAYTAWMNMLKRCFSKKYQDTNKTYVDVTVCDEWLSFVGFRVWWVNNYVDGWQLDKDLLTDNAEYSPNSCIYVPQWLNKFTTDHGADRGSMPIGVTYKMDAGKFRAQCCHPFASQRHIGYFSAQSDAHDAWLKRKLEIAAELKGRMDEIDERIYPRVIEIITRAK